MISILLESYDTAMIVAHFIVSLAFPYLIYKLRNRLTTKLRTFAALCLVGFSFSYLNVGPLGLVIGAPSVVMTAIYATLLLTRNAASRGVNRDTPAA